MKKRLIIYTMTLILLTTTIVGYQKLTIVNAASSDNVTTADAVKLDKPPFSYFKSDNVEDKKNKAIKLKVKSSKNNDITDEEKWFSKNKLSLKTYEVPNPFDNSLGNLPEGIDTTYKDLIITSAFYDSSYIYCTYGSDFSEGYILSIYDAKTLEKVYNLDFSSYRYAPKYVKADYDYVQQQINWATIKDGVLYVSHSHSTYAKSSKNMNGYITAIDLSDFSILWRTTALVSNANNFVIINDVIVCGYGFTNEPDYLYQVDLYTGKVLNKTLLKTSPYYIIKKGNSLYVRTYNTDYVFSIGQ